jgi:hypothetical protein
MASDALAGLWPARFSPLIVSSFDLVKESGAALSPELAAIGASAGGESFPSPAASESSLVGDPELPNILFSRPPWEEKLLLFPPASLTVSRVTLFADVEQSPDQPSLSGTISFVLSLMVTVKRGCGTLSNDLRSAAKVNVRSGALDVILRFCFFCC